MLAIMIVPEIRHHKMIKLCTYKRQYSYLDNKIEA